MVHLPVLLFTGAMVGIGQPWTMPAIVIAVAAVTAALGTATENQQHLILRFGNRNIVSKSQ